MIRCRVIALGIGFALAPAYQTIASADPMFFTFDTTLTTVSDSASRVLGVELHPGESFVGSVSFEVIGPDTTDNTGTAIFPAVGTIELPFLRMPMDFIQVILDEANPQLGDYVGFGARTRGTFPGPFENLFSVVAFVDPSGSLLTSTDVPNASLLHKFPGGPGQAFTISTDEPFSRLIEGTSTARSPVPEPGTMFLVAMGVGSLAWRFRYSPSARPRKSRQDDVAARMDRRYRR
jgi:hypothetical protein